MSLRFSRTAAYVVAFSLAFKFPNWFSNFTLLCFRSFGPAYSKNENCVLAKRVARPSGRHVLLERSLPEGVREMLFR